MRIGSMAIKLLEVELSEPLPAVLDAGEYPAAWVLVRDHGSPAGYVQFHGRPGRIPASDLAARMATQLGWALLMRSINKSLTDQLPEEPDYAPLISVLVCTRNRTESLKHTLDSLLRLDYPAYEVLVVDNAPSDDRTELLARQYPFRYIIEPMPGHSWVRNRAILESRGEIVAFIDDDMTADARWLRGIASAFSDQAVGCVTGLVLSREIESPFQELYETAYGGFSFGFESKRFPPGSEVRNYWFGTHCAYRKSTLEKLGMFDLAMGLPVGGAEDLDLLHRFIRGGYVLAYSAESLRYHSHRATYRDLRVQLHGYGKSMYALLTKCFLQEKRNRRKIVRFAVRYFHERFITRSIKRIMRREATPLRLIWSEGWGGILGPFAYALSVIRLKREMGGKWRRYGV